jgi:hypothetical protein
VVERGVGVAAERAHHHALGPLDHEPVREGVVEVDAEGAGLVEAAVGATGSIEQLVEARGGLFEGHASGRSGGVRRPVMRRHGAPAA